MTSAIKNVVLVGGSGNLGPFLIKSLLNHHFNLTVISRQSSNATFDTSLRVVKVNDSYPKEELLPVFKGQDAVVVSIRHASNSLQTGMIDAAVDAGIKHFIPSDYGSVPSTPQAKALDPRKGECESIVDYLRTKESTGLVWTSIITGLFFDLMLNHGFGAVKASPPRKFEIWDSGTATFSMSTRSTIADAVSRTLLHPQQTSNRYIHVSTFQTNQLGMLEAVKRVSGGDGWELTYVNSDEKIEQGKEYLKEGKAMMGLMNIVSGFAFSGKFEADFAKSGKLSNEMIGLPQEDVADVIAKWKAGS